MIIYKYKILLILTLIILIRLKYFIELIISNTENIFILFVTHEYLKNKKNKILCLYLFYLEMILKNILKITFILIYF